MARAHLPPTPAASTEISAEDKPLRPTLETSFTLPPPAISALDRKSPDSTSSMSSDSASASSYHPASPTSPNHKAQAAASPRLKRTLSGSKKSKEDFALPPPPTRPRKIIHMKPKGSSEPSTTTTTAATTISAPSSTGAKSTASTAPASASKRKTPSSTSVAGRKIARKTAHSLIERRRRSKMNEEFGTLKDMIPACEGQEMHKLAILQASIDYVRYLEKCIQDLKEANRSASGEEEEVKPQRRSSPPPQHIKSPSVAPSEVDHLPNTTPHPSPNIISYDESRALQRHYSFASSTTPTLVSPAFGPQQSSPDLSRLRSYYPPYSNASSATSISSASPSPNILPHSSAVDFGVHGHVSADRNRDHEATAALLMLTNDRRGLTSTSTTSTASSSKSTSTAESRPQSQPEKRVNRGTDSSSTTTNPASSSPVRMKGTGGMSVRDLLST